MSFGTSQSSSSVRTTEPSNANLSPLTPENIGSLLEKDSGKGRSSPSGTSKSPVHTSNVDFDSITQQLNTHDFLFNSQNDEHIKSDSLELSLAPSTTSADPTSRCLHMLDLGNQINWPPSAISSPSLPHPEIGETEKASQCLEIEQGVVSNWDFSVDPGLYFETNANKSIPPELGWGLENPEMLMALYDRQTCGILSVKDGISENPWRTLIWPLSKDSSALHHAICALTAFHCSRGNPHLRVHGMDHMRQSIRTLAMGLKNMRVDVALATTLTLVFAESWDRHISTGIQHLRGAKTLVSRATALQNQMKLRQNELARLRFLYNAWVYIDVISRLVSLDDNGSDDIPPLPFTPHLPIHEIDPLMGCATTLFPLISRAANLIQKVRKSRNNSMAIISQAIELKTLIEQWEAPKYFEPPEDPTSEVQHSFQTAQAYRWATLLYLHQAVPEIPSEPASDIAKRVLVLLATVPPSSRTLVVHIFPLLVASCEMQTEEDRMWVRERWAAMQSRLMIGSIDRCLEVIKEVWIRRRAFEPAKQTQQRTYVAPVDIMKRRSAAYGDSNTDLAEEWNGSPESLLFDSFDPSRPVDAMIDVEDWDMMRPLSPPMSTPISPVRKGSFAMGLEDIEYEKTVRGRLHWVGVMRDWGWEGTSV